LKTDRGYPKDTGVVCFHEMLFSRLLPLVFPRTSSARHPKIPLGHTARPIDALVRHISATIGPRFEKTCFWGVKTHNRDQWKQCISHPVNPVKIPKSMKMRRSSDRNFELGVARGSCGALQHTHTHTHIHTHTCAIAYWHTLHAYTRSAARNSRLDHARPS